MAEIAVERVTDVTSSSIYKTSDLHKASPSMAALVELIHARGSNRRLRLEVEQLGGDLNPMIEVKGGPRLARRRGGGGQLLTLYLEHRCLQLIPQHELPTV